MSRPVCDFCRDEVVWDAAGWLDDRPRPAPCPRCGRTYQPKEEQMRISAQIDGARKGETVTVMISTQDAADDLVLNVPTVGRAAACEFSVNALELVEAIEALKGGPKPQRGQQTLTPVEQQKPRAS